MLLMVGRLVKPLLWASASVSIGIGLFGCQPNSHQTVSDRSLAALAIPDPGPPTGRVLGNIVVRFSKPVSDVATAQALVQTLNQRIHAEQEPAVQFQLGPPNGQEWAMLITAAAEDVTLDQAITLLRAQPEIAAVIEEHSRQSLILLPAVRG